MVHKNNSRKSRRAPLATPRQEIQEVSIPLAAPNPSSNRTLWVLGGVVFLLAIVFLLKNFLVLYPAKKDYPVHLIKRFTGDQLPCGSFKTRGVCVAGQNQVALSDMDHYRILEFGTDGTFLKSFSPAINSKGPVHGLNGISSDTNGNIHVLDNSDKVLIFGFTPAGKPLATVDASPTGYFFNPMGVWCWGNYFVIADTGRNRIVTLRQDGSSQSIWGTGGKGKNQFSSPLAVVVDSQNRIFIADSGNQRIKICDPQGKVLNRIKLKDQPVGMAIDPVGRLFVCFNNDKFIQAYSAVDGKYLGDLKVDNPDSDMSYRNVTALCVTADGKLVAAEQNAISVYELPQVLLTN